MKKQKQTQNENEKKRRKILFFGAILPSALALTAAIVTPLVLFSKNNGQSIDTEISEEDWIKAFDTIDYNKNHNANYTYHDVYEGGRANEKSTTDVLVANQKFIVNRQVEGSDPDPTAYYEWRGKVLYGVAYDPNNQKYYYGINCGEPIENVVHTILTYRDQRSSFTFSKTDNAFVDESGNTKIAFSNKKIVSFITMGSTIQISNYGNTSTSGYIPQNKITNNIITGVVDKETGSCTINPITTVDYSHEYVLEFDVSEIGANVAPQFTFTSADGNLGINDLQPTTYCFIATNNGIYASTPDETGKCTWNNNVLKINKLDSSVTKIMMSLRLNEVKSNVVVKYEAESQEVVVENDYTDLDTTNHTCSVKSKNSTIPSGGVVKVPESVTIGTETYTVNAVAESGFAYKNGISKVILPNTITEIKANAFTNCSNMQECVIPNSITSIGTNAFYYCNSCTFTNPTGNGDVFPEGLTEIGDWAFYFCDKLENVNIPTTLTSLGDSAFYYAGVKSLTIKDGSLTSIPNQCFGYCPIENDLIIPSNIQSIDSVAFLEGKYKKLIIDSTYIRDIESNESFVFGSPSAVYVKGDTQPAANSYINNNYDSVTSDKPGYLKFVAKELLYTLTEDQTSYIVSAGKPNTDVTLPSTYNQKPVTTVGAFTGTNIQSITIPSSITALTEMCFASCYSLESVTFNTTSLTDISTWAFNGCSKLSTVNIPEGVENIEGLAFANCYNEDGDTGLQTVSFPSTITTIATGSFLGCGKLTADGLSFAGNNVYTIYRYDDWDGTQGQFLLDSAFNPNNDKETALKYLVGGDDGQGNTYYYRWVKNN